MVNLTGDYNRTFYNEMSSWYERDRYKGYHPLVYDLETELLSKYTKDKEVLEAGCGTGLILVRMREKTKKIIGFDLSEKMLKVAKERNCQVVQGEINRIPFKDKSFDVVCSFKVLAHIPQIKEAISEMARVVRDDGYLILEFYNPLSWRRINKAIVNSFKRITGALKNRSYFFNYNRYDSYWDIKKIIPPHLKIVNTRGIRIFTPWSIFLRIPLISQGLVFLERKFCDSFLKYFGGFFIVVLTFKS